MGSFINFIKNMVYISYMLRTYILKQFKSKLTKKIMLCAMLRFPALRAEH
jgi:hypothetical protein